MGNSRQLTLLIDLPDHEHTARPYLAAVVSTNELLDVWHVAGDSNPRGEHDDGPVLSKVVWRTVGPVNEREEAPFGIPVELRREAPPRLHQQRQRQAFSVPVPPGDHEGVAADPPEHPKPRDGEEDGLSRPHPPRPWHGYVQPQHVRRVDHCVVRRVLIHEPPGHDPCERAAGSVVPEGEEAPVDGRHCCPETGADPQKDVCCPRRWGGDVTPQCDQDRDGKHRVRVEEPLVQHASHETCRYEEDDREAGTSLVSTISVTTPGPILSQNLPPRQRGWASSMRSPPAM